MRSDPKPDRAESNAQISGRQLCETLEWDSAFFGRRIGRINRGRLNDTLARDVEAWVQAHRIECVYFLADPFDPPTFVVLNRLGFRLTDTRVTLECRVVRQSVLSNAAPVIREWREHDVPLLRAIAARSHRQSRFYKDGHFSPARCDELYATWIENSCFGYADHVLVAEGDDNLATGYLSLHREPGGRGRIGLLAVDDSRRGLGFGRALVQRAFGWFDDCGITTVKVATQAGNAESMSFYGRCGFQVIDERRWYHWWPGEREGEPE